MAAAVKVEAEARVENPKEGWLQQANVQKRKFLKREEKPLTVVVATVTAAVVAVAAKSNKHGSAIKTSS